VRRAAVTAEEENQERSPASRLQALREAAPAYPGRGSFNIYIIQSRGKYMKTFVRSAVLAVAVLSFVAPEAAQAQAKPAPAPAKSTAKKPTKATNEQRWASMLNSMAVLCQEGTEVKRITPAEKKTIDDNIAKVKAQIAAARQGGISEAEEDQIDNLIADDMAKIAVFWTDAPRKAAAPIAVKK
jgi:hypothetical protein